MPLKFSLPDSARVYTTKVLEGTKSIPKHHHVDIELLRRILPAEDELHHYDAPHSDPLKSEDWFEEGIAIVRDGNILILAKLEEYHDCGVY